MEQTVVWEKCEWWLSLLGNGSYFRIITCNNTPVTHGSYQLEHDLKHYNYFTVIISSTFKLHRGCICGFTWGRLTLSDQEGALRIPRSQQLSHGVVSRDVLKKPPAAKRHKMLHTPLTNHFPWCRDTECFEWDGAEGGSVSVRFLHDVRFGLHCVHGHEVVWDVAPLSRGERLSQVPLSIIPGSCRRQRHGEWVQMSMVPRSGLDCMWDE